MAKYTKYIREGEISFHKNRVRCRNPYTRGTKEHNEFERGWYQALKKCPEHLLKASK